MCDIGGCLVTNPAILRCLGLWCCSLGILVGSRIDLESPSNGVASLTISPSRTICSNVGPDRK